MGAVSHIQAGELRSLARFAVNLDDGETAPPDARGSSRQINGGRGTRDPRAGAGKPIAGFDALIAAVCRSQTAALATSNVSDFDGTGITRLR
jgi:predicted nucleic acid-binding protein